MMLIHLTPKGHTILQSVIPGHFKQMAAQMAPLSENERKPSCGSLTSSLGTPPPHT